MLRNVFTGHTELEDSRVEIELDHGYTPGRILLSVTLWGKPNLEVPLEWHEAKEIGQCLLRLGQEAGDKFTAERLSGDTPDTTKA